MDEKKLIVFYADWCSKCKLLEKELKKIKNIKITKINIDENRNLCKKYGIMSVPALIYFDKNKKYTKKIGYMTKDQILKWIG